MISRSLCIFGLLAGTILVTSLSACNRSHEPEAVASRSPSVSTIKTPENWLLGQWTLVDSSGNPIDEGCQRPRFQFGYTYLYWRGDVDGDPYDELNKVDVYRVEPLLIRLHVDGPTGSEPMIHKDGYMHFALQADSSVLFKQEGSLRPDPKLVKCPSSPLPYSPDVAPTPPRYDDIAPGIVQERPVAK